MPPFALRVLDIPAPGTSVVWVTMNDASGVACNISVQTGSPTATHRVALETPTGWTEGIAGRGPELIGARCKVFPALCEVKYDAAGAARIWLAFSIDASVLPVARLELRSRTAPPVVEMVNL